MHSELVKNTSQEKITNAHHRVIGVFNSVIRDPKTPDAALGVLVEAKRVFGKNALMMIGKRNGNRG